MERPALALAIAGLFSLAHGQAPKPLPIIAGNGWVNVLVEADGSVKTWGDADGQGPSLTLGDGVKERTSVAQPRPLAGVSDIVDVAVGSAHVLLLKRDGTLLAWGNNSNCELGTRNTSTVRTPIPVPAVRDVRHIAAKPGGSGAVLSDGSVRVWGDRTDTPCAMGVRTVEGLGGVKQLALGNSALALKEDGTVWGWGMNESGELCDGTTERRRQPAPVPGIADATFVAMDAGSTLIVLKDGTVRTCGTHAKAALGISPSSSLTPFTVPGVADVRSARMDRGTTIVHLADGTLRGWGNGYYGALGDGHGDRDISTPHAPLGLGPVLAHYMSGPDSYAIRADGMVMGWGMKANRGPTEFVLKPRAVFMVQLGD